MTRFHLFPKSQTLYTFTQVRGVSKETSHKLSDILYPNVRARLLVIAEANIAKVAILN